MGSTVLIANSANKLPSSKQEIARRDAKYHPSIWGDYFIELSKKSTDPPSSKLERIDQLKTEVTKLLQNASDGIEAMTLIDMVQRTGVAYHFETEINMSMERIWLATTNDSNDISDLHDVALRFRLLRQQGYNVSTDVFKRFMDDSEKFKENIANDIRGVLSLYDAAYLSVEGEVILDEALAFTTERLKASLTYINGSLARKVKFALEIPLHRCTERLKARCSIDWLEEDDRRNEIVLELAKLDFNLLQVLHQKELAEYTRWWKGMELATKLPFIRDRQVELYFWVLEALSEPQYARAREIMTRTIILISVMDDIYDVYGTLEELQMFTSAIERWDIQAADQLPDYMKTVYHALVKTFSGFEDLLKPEEKYRLTYLREAMITILKTYFVGAQWYYSGYMPSFDKYMENAVVSCGYHLLTVASFVGLEEIATKEVFDWAIKMPKIVDAASIICRLRDDIVGHKDEQEKGDNATGVECYMRDHGCTEEEAYKVLQATVDSAWKQMNSEFLHESSVPRAIHMRVIGLARIIQILYQYRDGYGDSRHETKMRIDSVLVNPIRF